MRRILVPYRFAEPLTRLGALAAADDAVVVARGEPAETAERIHAGLAARIARSDDVPSVLAGDALAGAAVVAGLQRRGVAPSVLWCSARAALHTPRDTTATSGGLDGTACATLLGWSGANLAAASGLVPLAPAHVALVDARAIDAHELAVAARAGIARREIADLATGTLPPPPWSVHLDLDLLDPLAAPPLRHPVPGGPGLPAVVAALGALRARGPVAALTVAASLTPRALDAMDPLAVARDLAAALLGIL